MVTFCHRWTCLHASQTCVGPTLGSVITRWYRVRAYNHNIDCIRILHKTKQKKKKVKKWKYYFVSIIFQPVKSDRFDSCWFIRSAVHQSPSWNYLKATTVEMAVRVIFCNCFFHAFRSLFCMNNTIGFLYQVPQKGKTGTKGQKQILEENDATLKFYRNMIGVVSAIYIVFNLVFGNIFSLTNIVR